MCGRDSSSEDSRQYVPQLQIKSSDVSASLQRTESGFVVLACETDVEYCKKTYKKLYSMLVHRFFREAHQSDLLVVPADGPASVDAVTRVWTAAANESRPRRSAR